ncbi:hypothetical protein HMPREF1624_04504 [Sporothrix schenckii ATCC 58251]|uniref:Rho-GAP domain-containing protein n=1 Tax=Sporothrix schenckii (strain ATCC 58251 / de Perez 2211183) TaxID=1391915 RepID=U7PXU9_SPOS1|nr:hypothetical protein HMPREF1624_04504 [Sporothrix schenckii ATCC 58251]
MDASGRQPFPAWPHSVFANDDRSADRDQMDIMPARPAYYSTTPSWTSNGSEADDPFTSNRGDSSSTLPRQNLLLHEYNRLAEKRGLRPLSHAGDEDEQDGSIEHDSQIGDRRNWFARTFGKPSAPTSRRSSRHSIGGGKHKRSDSDPSNQLQPGSGSGSKSDVLDTLKNQSLQTLVRTCGKSFLYLPTDYGTRSLMLPTCFRAAAQYLVQNGPETRGIFRISGSMRVVNELYDYYCVNLDNDDDIAATVRSPNLPFHIKAGVHDVASMFKRLLAGLPGGILGDLRLFEAFVEIMKSDGHASNEVLESGRADPGQMKARLMALAIGSVPGPLQRELMCAVFGLLSLIGHSAETTEPAQAVQGSALPHSELMGYAALGIIFGPLLMGELLDAYAPEARPSNDSGTTASPSGGPSAHGTPSPRSKSDKRRKSMASDKQSLAHLPSTLDKILLANDVAEMLITHWRAIVYEMKHMGIMRKESMLQHTHQLAARSAQPMPRSLRPSRSETFTDHNMGAMVQQASDLYSANLRKTRSASNTRNAIDAMSGKQPPVYNVPPQRPSDMSFEEFAARKKLRNYASNMSIASDSTYSAIEPQPVKPLSPPVEDPFYVPGSIAISTRSGAAKLTKQRRASGGFSSIFGADKAASSPTKDLPKVARKAVNGHSDGRSRTSEGDDNVAPPSSLSLSPTKVRGGVPHQTSDSRKASGSRRKATPTRSHHTIDAVDACLSEPAGRVGIGGTPQSKTAALIAKIMNTNKPPPTPTPVKRADVTTGDLSSRKQKAVRATHDTPRFFDSKSAGNSPTKTHGQWVRGNSSPATKPENRPIQPTAIVSPTPRRPWKAQASASVLAHGRESPPSSRVKGLQSPATRLMDTAGAVGRQSPKSRSYGTGKPPSTPQKKPVRESGAMSVKGVSVGQKSEDKQSRHATQEQRAIEQLVNDTTSPLSEIKNDARNMTRANSTSSRASKRTQPDRVHMEEPKSPAAGSSVKAMAAMFDTAAWRSSESLPLPLTSPQMAKPRTPKRGSALSQYTSNTSPSKTAEFVTPPHPTVQPRQATLDKTEGRGTDTSVLQRTASERRRLRLTKSEGRNGPLGKVGRLTATERRELARPVDRNEVRAGTGHQIPFGMAKDSTAKVSGKKTTAPPPPGNTSLLARGGTPVLSRSKGRPVSVVLSSERSASAVELELQRLLDSKTTECNTWKTRAQAAEAKVAELELALARTSVTDASKVESFTSVSDQGGDLSWSWQDLLPETAAIQRAPEKLDMSSMVREIRYDGAMPAPLSTVSRLRKDFETDDNNGSETSGGSDAHGRLINKRLLPF